MPRDDDSVVTWGEFKKFYRKLDGRISEAFEAIATGDETQGEFWNEHENKIQRHQRALKRHEDRLEALEAPSED